MSSVVRRLTANGFACVASLICIGCFTALSPPADKAEPIDINILGYSIEKYRGQTVRICGRLSSLGDGIWSIETIENPEPFYWHGRPAVFVVACADQDPKLDSDGCLTGRVALKDGSIEIPQNSQVVRDFTPRNPDWFVHPQCSGRR
jgi:hypothetical protein